MIRREFLSRAAAASAGLTLAPGATHAARPSLSEPAFRELPPRAPNSGFRLNLGFGGLCLFVPDTNASGKRVMHVLMPNAHEHSTWLVHDLSARMGWPPTGRAEKHPLNGTVVDLTNLNTQTPLDAVPASVANLTTICTPVPRRLLDNAGPPAGLTSRVTFDA